MLDNVQQMTIKPLIQKAITLGSLIYTDEYAIYRRLKQWGYEHITIALAMESMPEMRMEMGFTKFTSIVSRVFGHSYALGLDRIEVFLKINFLFI